MYGFLLNPISSKTSISWTWLMVSNAFFRSTNIYYIVDKPPASILLLISFVSDTNGTSCGHILLYYFILIIWKFFLPDWSLKLLSASLTTVFFYPNLLLNVFRYFWNVWRYFDSRPIYIYKHFNILFTRRIAEYKPFVQTHYFINYSKNTQWPHVEENTIWTFVKLASSPNIFLRFNRQLKIWHSFHMKVRV